ncbi:nuclear transport factor 2 family protein [Streptomyces sp. MC1]|uniref:nuclear transport factor 2 family protein n=1 Tax=Streptomyces sp. MC1 TaxID=295105 RepID=UPI0018CB8EA5|nr:nuclear transport factor 2 family protein [Streptomyces sp. MC1]MBG7702521.1 nuclear transport factor 2 family protein [Streptomyces sp. MC1]
MNTPIAQVVAEHLAVWNAPAGEERSRSIAALYSHDVIVAEPDTVYHGHDGVAEAIDALQAAVPGMRLELSGAIQTVQSLSTYSWNLRVAAGEPAATGRDVIDVQDRVITSVHVFLDPAPGE